MADISVAAIEAIASRDMASPPLIFFPLAPLFAGRGSG
jgi:hypothetical protein